MKLSPEEIRQLFTDPEALQIIDQRAELKVREREFPSILTTDEIAEMWQYSKSKIYRMTKDELFEMGYRRKKTGYNVRYERIRK